MSSVAAPSRAGDHAVSVADSVVGATLDSLLEDLLASLRLLAQVVSKPAFEVGSKVAVEDSEADSVVTTEEEGGLATRAGAGLPEEVGMEAPLTATVVVLLLLDLVAATAVGLDMVVHPSTEARIVLLVQVGIVILDAHTTTEPLTAEVPMVVGIRNEEEVSLAAIVSR